MKEKNQHGEFKQLKVSGKCWRNLIGKYAKKRVLRALAKDDGVSMRECRRVPVETVGSGRGPKASGKLATLRKKRNREMGIEKMRHV